LGEEIPLWEEDMEIKRFSIGRAIAATAIAVGSMTSLAQAQELSLAYFMGPNHMINKEFFTPMGEMMDERSGGTLTVRQFPGGALNGSPSKQYSILQDGVADMVFMDASSTSHLFPKTSIMSLPSICDTAEECTNVLNNSGTDVSGEFRGKLVGLWTNAPSPIIITTDKAIRTAADFDGMKLGVIGIAKRPFVEALGATPVALPITEVNQALANGIVDGMITDASAIISFKLAEAGKYVTTYFPSGPTTFAVLMNQEVYDGLSDESKAVVEAVADSELSVNTAIAFASLAQKGVEFARSEGLEIIEISAEERAKIDTVVENVKTSMRGEAAGDKTVGDMLDLFARSK
jgi:TRAP-type C4-dicarboxylate transport system substrate-binding protein